jgi:hypothetical protein
VDSHRLSFDAPVPPALAAVLLVACLLVSAMPTAGGSWSVTVPGAGVAHAAGAAVTQAVDVADAVVGTAARAIEQVFANGDAGGHDPNRPPRPNRVLKDAAIGGIVELAGGLAFATVPSMQAASASSGAPIDPAALWLTAGSGTVATTDGTGPAASFKDMGGVAVVSGFAYVGTVGAIRKVNLSTGAVTTLAGDPSATGCTDSTTPSSVRMGSVRSVTSDGTNLYAVSDCGVKKTVLSSGATSTLVTITAPTTASSPRPTSTSPPEPPSTR